MCKLHLRRITIVGDSNKLQTQSSGRKMYLFIIYVSKTQINLYMNKN